MARFCTWLSFRNVTQNSHINMTGEKVLKYLPKSEFIWNNMPFMLMKSYFNFSICFVIIHQNCCKNMKKIKKCTGAIKTHTYIYIIYAVVFLLTVLFLFLQRCMGRMQMEIFFASSSCLWLKDLWISGWGNLQLSLIKNFYSSCRIQT